VADNADLRRPRTSVTTAPLVVPREAALNDTGENAWVAGRVVALNWPSDALDDGDARNAAAARDDDEATRGGAPDAAAGVTYDIERVTGGAGGDSASSAALAAVGGGTEGDAARVLVETRVPPTRLRRLECGVPEKRIRKVRAITVRCATTRHDDDAQRARAASDATRHRAPPRVCERRCPRCHPRVRHGTALPLLLLLLLLRGDGGGRILRRGARHADHVRARERVPPLARGIQDGRRDQRAAPKPHHRRRVRGQ